MKLSALQRTYGWMIMPSEQYAGGYDVFVGGEFIGVAGKIWLARIWIAREIKDMRRAARAARRYHWIS
jgi:hypothetical protein